MCVPQYLLPDLPLLCMTMKTEFLQPYEEAMKEHSKTQLGKQHRFSVRFTYTDNTFFG